MDATGRSIGVDRYLRLPHYMLKSLAWRSLDATARCLFIEVAQRYNGANNGEIGLGVREAGSALHVRPQTAGVAFRRLIETGFLRVSRDSAFNVKSRLTREWTVTLFPTEQAPATHDFMKWSPRSNHSNSQMRIRPRLVANEDTGGNIRTSDSAELSHCGKQSASDPSGLNRTTSISHQGRAAGGS